MSPHHLASHSRQETVLGQEHQHACYKLAPAVARSVASSHPDTDRLLPLGELHKLEPALGELAIPRASGSLCDERSLEEAHIVAVLVVGSMSFVQLLEKGHHLEAEDSILRRDQEECWLEEEQSVAVWRRQLAVLLESVTATGRL